MRIRIISLIISIILGLTFFTACSGDNDSDTLVIGMELKYPPFETIDSDGNPEGISVDIANKLGEYLDRPVKIENIAFSGLIASLQTNKIDLIISSMTINETRRETIDFSDPYTKINLALLIAQDSPVESKSDLNSEDVTIAVKQGTTGHLHAMENYPLAQINIFDETGACILEVVQGKADVFIYDQMSIFEAWKSNTDKTRMNLNPLSDSPENWGIGIRKGEDELLESVNDFIQVHSENGFFDSLGDKYLSEIKNEFEERGIDFFFE